MQSQTPAHTNCFLTNSHTHHLSHQNAKDTTFGHQDPFRHRLGSPASHHQQMLCPPPRTLHHSHQLYRNPHTILHGLSLRALLTLLRSEPHLHRPLHFGGLRWRRLLLQHLELLHLGRRHPGRFGDRSAERLALCTRRHLWHFPRRLPRAAPSTNDLLARGEMRQPPAAPRRRATRLTCSTLYLAHKLTVEFCSL